MSDEKIINDPRYMALPPLRMLLGDLPQKTARSEPRPAQLPPMRMQELEIPVKRLIAHLEEKLK